MMDDGFKRASFIRVCTGVRTNDGVDRCIAPFVVVNASGGGLCGRHNVSMCESKERCRKEKKVLQVKYSNRNQGEEGQERGKRSKEKSANRNMEGGKMSDVSLSTQMTSVIYIKGRSENG